MDKRETKFKYAEESIDKELTLMEIAYQLKRIADELKKK